MTSAGAGACSTGWRELPCIPTADGPWSWACTPTPGAVLTQSGVALNHKTTVQAVVRVLDLETGRELEEGADGVEFFGAVGCRAVIFTDTAEATYPCGACRQVLAEFGADMEIVLANGSGVVQLASLRDLLPEPFRF